jgi:geranylgeranyl diphosphate synthase type II
MFDSHKRLIDNALNQLQLPANPSKLYDPIRYFLQIGGKRVRPTLVLMAAELYGGEQVERALPAAIAVELFHNFSLVHDDIMDQAPLRRGWMTVHRKWDANVAILSGDNLLILAYQELLKVDSPNTVKILQIFSQMAQEVCEGQQLDMDFETQDQVDEAAYLHMITCKTAVLLGSALKIGALIGGADEEDAERLYEFGTGIGVAFQLQDDLLDVYGQPEEFGKQVGGDILVNKKTILLISALSKAEGARKQELEGWLKFADQGDPEKAEQKIKAVTSLYNDLGVRQQAESLQQTYFENALKALNSVKIPADRLQMLKGLAQNLMTRNR